MKRFITGILTCVSLTFVTLPVHADTKTATPEKQETTSQQNLPFLVAPASDFQTQAVDVSGLSVWASSTNKCGLTLLTGKSNVEAYLLNKIYSNKDNLDAYYLKLSSHDKLEPQTISKEEKIKPQDGKEITVYQSSQTIQKQKLVFWDAFYQDGNAYATLLLQCAAPGMDNAKALEIFSNVKTQKVASLEDDIKTLPFKALITQPYYVSFASSTPPQYASMTIKQAIEQINEWPETEVFINYDAGPYANLNDFIDKSLISEQLQLKVRSKKQNTLQANGDDNNRVYIFDEEDGKNSSVLYLKRSDNGEVVATLAIINNDKLSAYRPMSDKINDSIEFNSKK